MMNVHNLAQCIDSSKSFTMKAMILPPTVQPNCELRMKRAHHKKSTQFKSLNTQKYHNGLGQKNSYVQTFISYMENHQKKGKLTDREPSLDSNPSYDSKDLKKTGGKAEGWEEENFSETKKKKIKKRGGDYQGAP